MAGRAVVPLQPDDGRAGKIALEAQDVVHLGAAPAVDRLVVVADAADVLVLLREQAQPEILRDVGVLVLVHQHVAEAVLVVGEHVWPLAEEPQALEQEVAEIGGVQRLQPLLILLVELARLAVGEGIGLAVRHLVRCQPAILPSVDGGGKLAGRPALLVDVGGDDDLPEQPHLVVGIEDGEVGPKPHHLGMPAQDFHTDRMERAEPWHALGTALADQQADAVSSSRAPPCW